MESYLMLRVFLWGKYINTNIIHGVIMEHTLESPGFLWVFLEWVLSTVYSPHNVECLRIS